MVSNKLVYQATKDATGYIANTIKCQKRLLDFNTLFAGYNSMGFSPRFNEKTFKDFYKEFENELKN